LGYASAEGGLIANLRVWENLLLPRRARLGPVPESTAELEKRIIEAFAQAGIEEQRTVGLMPQVPDRLSALERIVCALVRCHLAGFRLLVCDRIFDRLDEGRTRRVAALVDWLGRQHEGSALLVLRHSTRPVENSFGLRAWSPVNCIQLEEKSWLAS
jgi:ABC-type thiamine transport system ATPase subunit